jgi:hypothetical protein
MLDLLVQTFQTSAMAVTQLFLSAVITTNPWFEKLDVQYHSARQEVICSSRLIDDFTATLDDVLLSGKNITLHFRYDFFVDGTGTPLQSREIVNGLRYDQGSGLFYVIHSDDAKLRKFTDLESARKNYISVTNLVVAHTKGLSAEDEYYFRVTAYLDPVKLNDMSESVNLMIRWATVKPTIVSGKFRLKPQSA